MMSVKQTDHIAVVPCKFVNDVVVPVVQLGLYLTMQQRCMIFKNTGFSSINLMIVVWFNQIEDQDQVVS